MVNSALYWVFGLDTDTLPANYFDDPAAMTNFQEQTYYDQIKSIDDDFVPYLMPWFGTIVTASAFGCQIEYSHKADPAANPRFYPVRTPEDVERLQVIDPENGRPDAQGAGVPALHEGQQLFCRWASPISRGR